MSEARNLWLAIMNELDMSGTASDKHWEDLHEAYSSPSRFYHTITHIDKMAEAMREFAAAASLAVRFAILYHDVIYNAKGATNEEDSAVFASVVLRALGCSEYLQEQTANLILCTKKHIPLSSEPDDESALLLDLDLLILGSSPDEYEDYRKNVREEYRWVAKDQFASARAAILRRFLARETIFLCPLIRLKYEESARSNLSAELHGLEKTSARSSN